MLQSLNQLNRRLFWTWTIPIVVAYALLGIAVVNGARVGPFGTVLILLLAYVVAGRFRDIGWPAWLGPAFILVTMLGIPAVAMGLAIARDAPPDELLQSFVRVGLFTGLANLIPLIIVGSVPGGAAPPEPE